MTDSTPGTGDPRRRVGPDPFRESGGIPDIPGTPDIPDIPDLPDFPDLPDVPSGPTMVAGLDPELPLVLFPVRLATRYHRPDPGEPPTELWVRIFPDLTHADGHSPGLTEQEVIVGRSYWERIWRASTDAGARLDAHGWLVSQVDAPRAAWVAERSAPKNPERAPTAPVPAPLPLEPAPAFGDPPVRTETTPTRARLLPDRWCVIARESVEFVKREWTSPVRHYLAMAPDLAELPEGGDVADFLRAQDLWWMVDFPTALRAGMAVRLRLPPPMRAGIERLLVFGVRADDTSSAEELAALLEAQRFSQGLGFVPQGTPTNNTDTVASPWSDVPTDLEAFLGPIAPSPLPEQRSGKEPPGTEPPGRVPPTAIDGPATGVGDVSAADALATTFGLDGAGALAGVEHAEAVHTAWARPMNRILWPVTVRRLLRNLLATDGDGAISEETDEWFESWFHDWVLGPGMLPALRIGNQPYGVLPVIRRLQDGTEPGRWGDLSLLLHDVEYDWMTLAPNFSATRLDLPPTPEEEAVRLAAVLGAVPHPTAFRLREALDQRLALGDEWGAAIATLENDLFDDVPDELHDEYYLPGVDDTLRGGSISDQSSALFSFRAEADFRLDTFPLHEEAINAVLDHIDDVMLPMVTAHKLRSESRALGDGFSGATLGDDLDPDLWYLEYGDDGSGPDGAFPELRLVPEGGPTETARILRDFADDVRKPGPALPGYLPTLAAPLLVKLAQQSVRVGRVPYGEQLASAFDELADLIDAADPETAMADLERTLRETLGLVTHRWDAWVTSFANHRLDELRAARPDGAQVGGFGWLTEIVPDEGDNDSDGFIHAPSLDHATTAAILRSSWLAYADEYDDAPFSVDLSSDRVRRAMWVLDGVRNGVDLGELLGSRFERRLHDGRMSELIHDVRTLVLDAAGDAMALAEGIVDGLALAVAYSDSTQDDPVRAAIDGLRATLPGYPEDRLLRVLEQTVGDLDATADLLTAQAVHSVAKGNTAEAASVLSLSGAGATSVPEIRLPHVHRESRLVEHRLAAILPAAQPGTSLATMAEPTLAEWVAELLPALDTVRCRVRFDDGQVWDESVTGAGLAAYDVVTLCSAGGDLSSGRLLALLIARARFELNVPTDVGASIVRTDDAPSLHDLAVAAGALRTALGAARALRPGDLAAREDNLATADVDDLVARRSVLVDHCTEMLGRAADDALLEDHFADFVAVDPGGLIAALAAGADERPRLVEALLARVKQAMTVLDAEFDPADEEDPKDPNAHVARIVSALGLTLPVLPRFEPANRDDLVASLDRSGARLGAPLRAMSWLLQTGRVHDGAGRCATALDLVELVNPDADLRFTLAQLPDVEGEPWIAFAAPDDGRLGILSITDAQLALDSGPVAGLLFDSWSEPVPGRRATTGVAVHFDRPGAQAPQSILVAVTPTWGSWSVEELEVILGQTFDLVRARATGPETMLAWSHTLPAVYLDPATAVETIEPQSTEAVGALETMT